jgi:hypothetical protein
VGFEPLESLKTMQYMLLEDQMQLNLGGVAFFCSQKNEG